MVAAACQITRAAGRLSQIAGFFGDGLDINSQTRFVFNELHFMKSVTIIGVVSVGIVMVGCSKEPSSSSTTPPPDGKPVAVSDGSNAWQLGATTINGTNVSATNVTVGIRVREASK